MGAGISALSRVPPYLPFLSGPASTAPKLRPIPETQWLFPDTEADAWLTKKTRLMKARRSEVYGCEPDAMAAANEAASLVIGDHMDRGDWPTGLEAAASQVSDDLCVMVPREGAFVLGAASLCAATFWRLEDKIGHSLGGLHHTVPGGDPELSGKIFRIFSGLQPDIILERFNWTVQLGPDRFSPSAEPMKRRLKMTEPDDAANELYLRVERQTVRKLPDTGAVLFTIRICVDRLWPILEQGDHAKRFSDSWYQTNPQLAAYKGWPDYQPVISWLCNHLAEPGTEKERHC